MPTPHELRNLLIPLRDQLSQIDLEDDSEAADIAAELRYLISQFSPAAHSSALRTALSDMDAAEGRIHEYIDTPQGPDCRNHQEAAVSRLDDAIDILFQSQP